MKCARCNRPLRAATIQISGCNYGPKCADRMGLTTTKPKRNYSLVMPRVHFAKPDPNQLPLNLEWMP